MEHLGRQLFAPAERPVYSKAKSKKLTPAESPNPQTKGSSYGAFKADNCPLQRSDLFIAKLKARN